MMTTQDLFELLTQTTLFLVSVAAMAGLIVLAARLFG